MSADTDSPGSSVDSKAEAADASAFVATLSAGGSNEVSKTFDSDAKSSVRVKTFENSMDPGNSRQPMDRTVVELKKLDSADAMLDEMDEMDEENIDTAFSLLNRMNDRELAEFLQEVKVEMKLRTSDQTWSAAAALNSPPQSPCSRVLWWAAHTRRCPQGTKEDGHGERAGGFGAAGGSAGGEDSGVGGSDGWP